MTDYFYPPLSTLLPLNRIPDDVTVVRDGLENVFGHLYIKDLQIDGDRYNGTYYNFNLIAVKRIAVEPFGTDGIGLVLNPGYNAEAIPPVLTTEFTVSVYTQWEVLKYLNYFNLQTFDWSVESLYGIVLSLARSTNVDLFLAAITHADSYNDLDVIESFIDRFNLKYNPPVPLVKLSNDDIVVVAQDILNQLTTPPNDYNILSIVFDDYLNVEGGFENFKRRIESTFRSLSSNFSIDGIKSTIIPTATLVIKSVSLALEFPRTVLIPLNNESNSPDFGKPLPAPIKSNLSFVAGNLIFSTESGFEFEQLANFNFSKSQIGNTGLTLEFTNMKLDLSRNRSIPEATAAGYSTDFIGVFVEEAVIGLPPKWFKTDPAFPNQVVSVVGRQLLIGTGGINGTIALETTGPPTSETPLRVKLGSVTAALESFDIAFRQNKVIASNINGWLRIPGFKDSNGNDAQLDITAHLSENGDFSITVTEQDTFAINIPGVLTFTIRSAEVGRQDDKFYFAISGLLEFVDQGGFIGKFIPSQLEIKKLLIWEDGGIEFEGGSLQLPSAITLNIGPAKISVTAIHLGSHEQFYKGVKRKYRYFGFDGGVSVNPGGVDARGDGVKLYFTVDEGPRHVFVRLQGLAIDLILPAGVSKDKASLILSGYLSIKSPDTAEGQTPDPNAGTEFSGGVAVTLPKVGISGMAAMRYKPAVPSFIVDLGFEFPAPIPIFGPLGIYGFRGLFGRRYVASRTYIGLAPDASWYLYYKKKVSPENREGIFVSKFDTSREGFSLGVGASIATTGDDGFSFSSKLFLMLSLPEVFLLQGQAAIFKKRIGLNSTSDPPFSALISISSTAIEANFGVNYKLPESNGSIIQVDALAEIAFFRKNAKGWYVNIGRDLPEDKRVRARILSLFNMYSYLMLSSQGLKMGAGAKFELNKKFGPIKVELRAYLDLTAKLSVRPLQLGGGIYMGGSVGLKIFGFGFRIAVDAGLAVEAPKPFIISGFIKVCVRVLRKNRCVTIDFTFTFNRDIDNSEVIFLDYQNISAVHVVTGETFPVNYTLSAGPTPPGIGGWVNSNFDNYVLPLDTHIDFEFLKGIALGSSVTAIGKSAQAFSNTELIPPQKGKSPQVRHTYSVEQVKIWSLKTDGQWQEYKIYNALTPLQDASFVNAGTLANLREGWLQLDTDGKYKRLRMLSTSPLSYTNQGVDISSFDLEDLGLTESDLFCPQPTIPKTCFDYEEVPLGIVLPSQLITSRALFIRVISATDTLPPHVVQALNPFGKSKGLMVHPGDQIEFIFKQPMAQTDLRLNTLSSSVSISFYGLEVTGETVSRQPQFGYRLIKVDTLQPESLLTAVSYDNVEIPVSKIVVTAGTCTGGGGGDGDGGGGDGDGGGGDHDCNCDCVKCCGTSASGGIPRRDGNTVDALLDVYRETNRKRELLNTQQSTLERELSLNTVTLNRLMNTPAVSPTQQNDYRLEASRFRFRKEELEDSIVRVETERSQFDTVINQLQPLVDLVDERGQNDPEVIDLARDLYNSTPTQTEDFTCKTLFFELCYLTVSDYFRNQTTPTPEEVLFDLSSITDGYSKTIHPLWRPDTTYAITVKTKDQVTVPEKTSANRTYERYYHVGFRTKGPIGHFHPFNPRYNDLKKLDREAEFVLTGLRPYIDFDKSFPNADGRLTNAKPIFYQNPQLFLFYKYAHVYNMYGSFESYNSNPALTNQLKVLIKDPAEPITSDSELIIEQTGVGFVTTPIAARQPDANFFNNLTRGSNCVQIVPVNPIGIKTEITPAPLKPLKLYSAIFWARYNGKDEEVHRFGFQTSRYADFQKQIESYRIFNDDGVFVRDAIYDNLVTIQAPELAKVGQLLSGTLPETDTLWSTFQHPYDLLMNGLLKLSPINPATGTEISLLLTSNNIVIGLLVRNPEPFNDPKIPLSVLANSLQLSINGGPVTDNKVLFAKDNASAFISNAALNLNMGPASVVFRYYQFNGSQYEELQSVTIDITINIVL
jgi:hypothetical protein